MQLLLSLALAAGMSSRGSIKPELPPTTATLANCGTKTMQRSIANSLHVIWFVLESADDGEWESLLAGVGRLLGKPERMACAVSYVMDYANSLLALGDSDAKDLFMSARDVRRILWRSRVYLEAHTVTR